MHKRPNTIMTMGLMATVTPYGKFDSASRVAMLSHHLDQAINPKESDIPRSMTGFERQLKAFDIRMPCDAIIISIHHKFIKGFDRYAIKDNPTITIIFQDQSDGTYDTLDITRYHSKHRIYGSKFVWTQATLNLRPGQFLKKDTLLAVSPTIKAGGLFSNGLNCEVINLSVPGVIEDGYVVSDEFCRRASLLELPAIVGQWGCKMYPLNTYGDENEFKAYPDVGEKIRDDGLVFAFREYNDTFNAIEMTNAALMNVDMIHDIRIYGAAGATVYDITVESGIGESKAKPMTSTVMAAQSERYIKHGREYYRSLLEVDAAMSVKNKDPARSPALRQLLVRALADTPNSNKDKGKSSGIVRRTHRGVPIDEYYVEIKAYREVPIGLGSKMTGYHGDLIN